MDDQTFKRRVTVGLILLGAVFVALGFLPGLEWWAGVLRMIG